MRPVVSRAVDVGWGRNGEWWEGGGKDHEPVAGGGRLEQALGARWQRVGGGRGRTVRWGGIWWEAGRRGRKCEGKEFKNVFVYFFTLGWSKGKWGWGCFPFPMGSGSPAWTGGSALGS